LDVSRAVKSMTELWASGRQAEALATAQQIVERFPLQPRANELLAMAHGFQGRWADAAACLERAAQSEPSNAGHHYALGIVRGNTGDAAGAAAGFRRALELSPRFADAMVPLAESLSEVGEWAEAERVLTRALAMNPNGSNAIGSYATLLGGRGRSFESEQVLRKALAANPSAPELIGMLCSTLNYVEGTNPAEVRALRERYGRMFGQAAPMVPGSAPNSPDPDRPLRIAYLSPDFRLHPVAFFTESFLPYHDRERYETYCYYTSFKEDDMTRRIRAAAAHWRHMPVVPDPALVAQIRADRIDVLVELSGITGMNRLAALARRTAPVQATYIGSPASTGVPAIDYRLVDGITDPPGAEVHATERLVRIDGCFLCFRPPEDAPPVAPPPSAAGGPVTFGSFNNLAKLSPGSVRLWSRLLQAVPGSRLLLKSHTLADPAARESILGQFAAAGIGPDRLELAARIPGMHGHLGAYSRIDVAIDTFPYNGTTTTCDALWMGVPVVTLAGAVHAGRVGASLLTVVGHPEWVAASENDYVRIAADLAQDPARLATLRAGLRDQVARSRLCDGKAHAAALESAYRSMWRAWCGK
jgi:predicted O-linked N-acetylglucosamine transferase (SPINDLY family)